MGRTYKDNYKVIPKNKIKASRNIKKSDLKGLSQEYNRQESAYNELKGEDFDEGNFEKFSRRR